MATESSASIPTLFQNIGCYFKGKSISLLSTSPTGDLAALAGKKGIFFVDLQDPWELQSRIKLKAGFLEVHALKWSKDPTLLATAHGVSVLLWRSTADGRWTQLSQTQTHRRTITDVSWSRIDQGFYTTCAGDGICKAWDVRQSEKPALLLKKLVDNVPPVRSLWSPHDAVKIATVNGNQVLLWDLRKTEAPIVRIFAATGEVTSLDWSYSNKSHLLTCSREHRFRIWSSDSPDESIGGGLAAGPVERGLYSPFGNGIVVTGKANNLFQLFNAEDPTAVTKVGSFGGNGNAVSDFQWRKVSFKGNDEFQLVSWSTSDEQLRLFPMETEFLDGMGYRLTPLQRSRTASFSARSRSLTQGASDGKSKPASTTEVPLASSSDVTDGVVVMTMEEEFETLRPMVGVTLTKLDKLNRSLCVEIRFHENEAPLLSFEMSFPSLYPYQVPPSIAIIDNFTQVDSAKIKEEISALGSEMSLKNLNSIEACIKFAQNKFVQDPILLSLLEAANERKSRAFNSIDGDSSPQPRRTFSRASTAIHEKLASLGPEYELYLIKPSDTIAAIALSFGMDRAELRSLNSIHHSGQLLAGREIIVRKRPGTPASVLQSAPPDRKPVSTLEKLMLERDASGSSTMTGVARSSSGSAVGRLSLDSATKTPKAPAPKPLIISDSTTSVPVQTLETLASTVAKTSKRASNSTDSSPRLTEKRPSGTNLADWNDPSLAKSNVFKSKIDLLLTNKDVLIAGQITLTQTQVIFEPNLDDSHVKRHGVHKYTVVFESQRVTETSSVRVQKSAGDQFCLQVVTDEVQPATGSKLVHFVGPETRITEISRRLQGKASLKRENALASSLNLESSAGVPRVGSALGRPAVPSTPSKRKLDQSSSKSSLSGSHGEKKSSEPRAAQSSVSVATDAPAQLKSSSTKNSSDPNAGHGLGLEGSHGLGIAMGQGLGEGMAEVGLGLASVKDSLQRALDKADEETAASEKPTLASHVLPTSLPEELLGRMLDKSFILELADFRNLRDMLPEVLKDKNWRRLFTTQVDGTSMHTFYNKIQDEAPTFVLVKDTHGHVFGGFASEEWRPGVGFHGTGECFVFALRPKVACYRWTEANEFFMIASREFIAMGGGVTGRYAFYVDGEFCWGTSEVSNTFLNRRLASSEEFQCAVVEVWTLTTDSDSEGDV